MAVRRPSILSTALVFLIAIVFSGVLAGCSAETDVEAKYPVNDRGMTYGSIDDANSMEDQPDLIEVSATNGNKGYVKKDEYQAALKPADNPEDAVRMTKEREEKQFAVFYEILTSDNPVVNEDPGREVFQELLGNPEASIDESVGLDANALMDAFNTAVKSTSQQIDVFDVNGVNLIGKFEIG